MENSIKIQVIEERKKLGIDILDPIEKIENLLQKKMNISIIKKQIEGSVYGICSRSEDGVMAILVNTDYSLGRQNFTIAYEYYHLMYDENLYEYSKEKERKANIFASYFLMPTEALDYYMCKKNLSKNKNALSSKDIIEISTYFGLSYLATIVRLEKFEKMLTREKAEEYKKLNAEELAKSNGICTDLYKATKEEFWIITDYVDEVQKALMNEKITEGKYESLLLEGGFDDIVFGLDANYMEVQDGKEKDYL